MKERTGFRKGYVRVRIQGEQTERFLNLCRARRIKIYDLTRDADQCLNGCFQLQDFFRLLPVRRKTKVKIHILEKHGLPFFFYRSKKRKAFFLGVILCMLLFVFFTGRLWEIDVEGNIRNSTPEILGFLKEQGIVHGMARSRISCSKVAAEIRERYPDIKCGIKFTGGNIGYDNGIYTFPYFCAFLLKRFMKTFVPLND